MIICTAERHPDGIVAPCHQQEAHDNDHIAYLESADGRILVASWHGDQQFIALRELKPFNDETTGLEAA